MSETNSEGEEMFEDSDTYDTALDQYFDQVISVPSRSRTPLLSNEDQSNIVTNVQGEGVDDDDLNKTMKKVIFILLCNLLSRFLIYIHLFREENVIIVSRNWDTLILKNLKPMLIVTNVALISASVVEVIELKIMIVD